jgi:hypothetical protein
MSSMLAYAGTDCHPVGGTISTNFLDSSTTLGSATGDLAGGIGVSVKSTSEGSDGTLIFHNEHHWVTAAGDTINALPADATAYPTGTALFAASYLKGVTIKGGTGKFAHATGTLYMWGAVNEANFEVVLRYEGKICKEREGD